MSFYFSRRKIKPKEEESAGELNIVPYLDILMNLIIFMLLSMTGLATFGVLSVNAPVYGAGASASDSQQKPLLLTEAIGKKGFYVAASGGVIPGQTEPSAAAVGEGAPTVTLKADGQYDYEALNEKMKEVKTAFPAESQITMVADADTPYEALVGCMDATRETKDRKPLFPVVTLASF